MIKKIPSVTFALTSLTGGTGIERLLEVATPEEQKALLTVIQDAYRAGQDDADQRSGKLMARIFGGFVGVTPGIDINATGPVSARERMKGIVTLLAGAIDRK